MNFGQKQLEKYGWKQGDGLGKSNQGMINPIKANLKFDNAGLGHDRASDFNNHWWERVYNEASTNIIVDKEKNGISVKVKEENAVELTTNSYSTRKFKELHNDNVQKKYNNFLKVSTLTKNGVKDDETVENKLNDIELPKVKVLTDEELFKACQGRTAHKGARHGIKQSGKLSRIAEQERNLIEKLNSNPSMNLFNTWNSVKSKKKRKTILKPHEEQEPEDLCDMIDNESDYSVFKSKTKRKKKKRIEEEISTKISVISIDDNDKQSDTNDDKCTVETNHVSHKKRKNKKNKNKNKCIDNKLNESVDSIKSKLGKKRKVDDGCSVQEKNNEINEKNYRNNFLSDESDPNSSKSTTDEEFHNNSLKTYKTLDDLTKIPPMKKRRIEKYLEMENLNEFNKKHVEKAVGKIPISKKIIKHKKKRPRKSDVMKLTKSIQKFDLSEDDN